MDYSVEQMVVELPALKDHLEIERAHMWGIPREGQSCRFWLSTTRTGSTDWCYSTWTKSDRFMQRVFDVRKLLLTASGAVAYIRATPIMLFPDWYINEHAAEFASTDDFSAIDIAVSRCDAVINFDRGDQLAVIKSPTLVLCAGFLTPIYFSEQLEEIVGARFIRLPRGGHASSQTVPDEFNAAVLSFLRNSLGSCIRSTQRDRCPDAMTDGAKLSCRGPAVARPLLLNC